MNPPLALIVLAGFMLSSDVRAQAPAEPRTDLLGDPLPAGAVARLGTLRFKHISTLLQPQAMPGPGVVTSTVAKAVFSPDGSKIATLAHLGPTIDFGMLALAGGCSAPGVARRMSRPRLFLPTGSSLLPIGLEVAVRH